MDVIVTVYLFFPVAQLLTLPKTPTLSPGEAVEVLNIGVATTAQPEPPLDPPPPFPFCADNGTTTNAKHASAKKLLTI